MKKTILGIILTVALLVAMVGNVNAASVSANKTTVKAGEKVVVTISTEEEIKNADFSVKYDKAKFKYVETTTTLTTEVTDNDMKDAEGNPTGEVYLSMSSAKNTTKAISVTFEALKDVKDGEAQFSVEGYNDTNKEELTTSSVKVNVEAVKQDDPSKEDPKDDPKEDPKDESKDTPTKVEDKNDVNYKQTGAPVYAGIIAVIVVAGAVLLIRKAK